MTDAIDSTRDYAPPIDNTDMQRSGPRLVTLDRARAWGGERPRISLAAALVLAAGAGVGTRIYLQRRAEARLRRLAWFALTARSLRGAVPPARTAAPLGGASGAALLAMLMVARARYSQKQSGLEELRERLAALEGAAAARPEHDKLRPRDVAIGAAIGLGLSAVVSRLRPRQSN